MRVFLLLNSLFFAGVLCAQYVPAASSAPYVERTGTSSVLTFQNGPNFDDNCLVVTLPFDFTYFDRTYRHCYMSTNGRITFAAENATTFSTAALTPTVPTSLRDTIHVISGDLVGGEFAYNRNFSVFFEAGRVVFQWRNVSFFTTSRHAQYNFQCHLLATNEIEFYFGPVNAVTGFSENPILFVSGLANFDGTVSVAGYGAVTTVQNALPAGNSKVTFTPSFVAAAGVRIQPGTEMAGASGVAGNLNVPVLSFRLAPIGAGATVTQLQMTHNDFTGSSVAVELVRDTPPLGQFNGETVLAASTQAGGLSTFSGLSEAITTAAVDYLVVFDLNTVNGQFIAVPIITSLGSLPASVSGGARGVAYDLGTGASVTAIVDSEDDAGHVHYAGATNRRLGGFMLSSDPRLPATNLTQFSVNLAFGALPTTALANVRLWRDQGALGVLDGSDVALTAGGVAAATVTFTGFNEAVPRDGVMFFVTADVDAALSGFGSISMTLNAAGCAFSTAGVQFFAPIGAQGFNVLGTAAAVFARGHREVSLSFLRQQGGDTNVPALAFTLQANTGAPTLSALTFQESIANTAGISAARLYLDTGVQPGRFDSGDTLCTGTVTVNAANIAAASITNVTLGAASLALLLVIDFNAGAASINRSFTLAGADITVSAGTVQAAGLVGGPAISVGAGTASAGVDVTLSVASGSLHFGGTQYAVIAAMSCTPRGTGGNAPSPRFSFVTAAGGIGNFAGVQIEIWREGAGPLGQWDASDQLLYLDQFAGDTSSNLDSSPNGTVLTGSTVNYLYLLRRSSSTRWARGDGRIVFRGLQFGTNVHLLPVGSYPGSAATLVDIETLPIVNGGGDDGGGCTTGEQASLHLLALLGALAAISGAGRLRRCRVAA